MEIDYERFYGSCFTIYNYWISVVIIIVNNKKNKSKESYICEGMCFGMSFGLLILIGLFMFIMSVIKFRKTYLTVTNKK